MQQQATTTIVNPDPKKIALNISQNNNGYSSLAEAFINMVKHYGLTDSAAEALFAQTRQFWQQLNSPHEISLR